MTAFRILANENFPGDAISVLRQAGFDILWAREAFPGATDEEVLKRGVEESRLLITFDKDLGSLAFQRGLPASTGIVLFRIPMNSGIEIGHRAVTVLESREDWGGNFSVVNEDRLRIRPLK